MCLIIMYFPAIALSLQEEKTLTSNKTSGSLYPTNLGGAASSSPTPRVRDVRKVGDTHTICCIYWAHIHKTS